MAKLMTCAEAEALRSAAGGSFEMAAWNAGLLIGIDVRIDESERGYTVECLTPRASAWLAELAAKVN